MSQSEAIKSELIREKWEKLRDSIKLKHVPDVKGDFFTKELLELDIGAKDSVLHALTRYGMLKKVPSNLMTSKLLMKRDIHGNTVYHQAAERGEAGSLPNNCWNLEVLKLRNNFQTTVLHLLTDKKQLNLIPKGLLNKDLLLMRDREEQTVMHYLAYRGTLSLLDIDLLDDDTLAVKDNKKISPLVYVTDNYDPRKKRAFLEKILTKISSKNLRIFAQIACPHWRKLHQQLMTKRVATSLQKNDELLEI